MTLTSVNTICLFRISQRIHGAHRLLGHSHTFYIDKQNKRFLSIGFFHEAHVFVPPTRIYSLAKFCLNSMRESTLVLRSIQQYAPRERAPLGLLEINSFHRETLTVGIAKSDRKLRLICVAGT